VTVPLRLLAALVLVVAALASPAAGADRLKRYAIAGEGASFSVPSSWVAISGRQIRTQALLDQLARENPRLAPFVRSFAQAGSAIKFVALDPAVKGGFATNVNVLSLAVPASLTLEQYRQVLLAELRTLTRGARIDESSVRIGGNEAIRLAYRFRLNAGGRAFTVQTLQYGFLRSGKSVVFTYTTTPRFAAGYARTFQASASSIRFRG
jgi:hypothetical protein